MYCIWGKWYLTTAHRAAAAAAAANKLLNIFYLQDPAKELASNCSLKISLYFRGLSQPEEGTVRQRGDRRSVLNKAQVDGSTLNLNLYSLGIFIVKSRILIILDIH